MGVRATATVESPTTTHLFSNMQTLDNLGKQAVHEFKVPDPELPESVMSRVVYRLDMHKPKVKAAIGDCFTDGSPLPVELGIVGASGARHLDPFHAQGQAQPCSVRRNCGVEHGYRLKTLHNLLHKVETVKRSKRSGCYTRWLMTDVARAHIATAEGRALSECSGQQCQAMTAMLYVRM
jgi:hypothetical protein